jgi:transposase InsO family protein
LAGYTILDENTTEYLATLVARNISSEDVIDQLFHLFIFQSLPEHLRSDNSPEFTAKAIRYWLNRLGVKTLFIELSSPGGNGYIESFNRRFCHECLNENWFLSLDDAREKVEICWRQVSQKYTTNRQ